MRLLLIEDEADLADALADGLRREGYAVDTEADGCMGLELLEIEPYDLVILDLNLPGLDGMEIARRIRPVRPELFILMLTARGTPAERVTGLNWGADDYLTKPFHFEELVARIQALLRRDLRVREPRLSCQDLVLDPATHAVWRGDERLRLARKEFAILELLMRRPGEVVSQEVLLEHVWDSEVNPLTNVVPVHINVLRATLGDNARQPRYIRTIVGTGYQLLTVAP